MGNGIFKSCIQEGKFIEEGVVSYRNIDPVKGGIALTPYTAAKKIQDYFLHRKAKKRIIDLLSFIYKSAINSAGELIENQSVDLNLMLSQYNVFKNSHQEGIRMNSIFEDLKKHYHLSNIRYFYVTGLKFRNTDCIYNGYVQLSKSEKNLTIIKKGYGCLYKNDGTLLEGDWDKDDMLNDGIIYYRTGYVYVGEIKGLKENGVGSLFRLADLSTNKKEKKEILKSQWKDGELSGEGLISIGNRLTVRCCFNRGMLDYSKAVIEYKDGTRYEGGFNSKFYRNDYGVIVYPNGEIYEGYWNNDKYHGEGVLYKISNDEKLYNGNNLVNTTFQTVIKARWWDGHLHGHGTVTTKGKMCENLWRYGILLITVSKLKNKILLHQNVLSFLESNELISLIYLKNKDIADNLKKNYSKIFLKYRLSKLGCRDTKEFPILENKLHFKNTFHLHFNKYLIDRYEDIINISDVFKQNDTFIPILGYECNGGIVQKRLHYSNIFTPDMRSAYSSNYIHQRKNDIVINGILNPNFMVSNGEYINSIDNTESLIQKSSAYVMQYESILKTYNMNLNQMTFHDSAIINLSEAKIERNFFFTVSKMLIHVPIKHSIYTVLANPVKTLAVYLHQEHPEKSKDNINFNFINSFNLDSTNINSIVNALKPKHSAIKITDNSRHTVIEFDTEEQYEANPAEKQLLALVVLKEYNEPHVINFKNYYHRGKYLCVKLIDQNTLYNYNKTGIDIGSLILYGQVFELKKDN